MQIDEQAIYRVVNWNMRRGFREIDPIGGIRQFEPDSNLLVVITLEHPGTGEQATITLHQELQP